MATSFAPTLFSPAPPKRQRAGGLSAGRLAGFSALAAPIAAAQVPIGNFLPAIYAQQFGISLAALGTIFLAERIWGTFADPLVGALSDRTHSRFGRRRPWIAGGIAIYALATLALFFPPAGVSPLYLGAALFAFYLGWSMIQIPYFAWSGEISGAYHERTRIATYMTVASSIALLLVLVLPAAIDQWRPGDDRLKLGAMGGVILLMLAPAAWLTLRAFPEAPAAAAPARGERPRLAETLRLVFGEKLLLRVLLSDLAVTFGQGIRGALFIFVVSIYMGLPQWGSLLLLSQFVFGIAAGPIWMGIAKRIGKHRTAIAGELAQAAINLSLLAIAPGNLALLIGLTFAQGLAQSSGNLMLRSMVADIADHHRLRTGHDRTALFFSTFSISMKAGLALAVGVALPLVGYAGFHPGAHNTPAALHALLLTFALGPALAHLCSAALLRGFPLDESAHADVRRALDRQAAA